MGIIGLILDGVILIDHYYDEAFDLDYRFVGGTHAALGVMNLIDAAFKVFQFRDLKKVYNSVMS